MEDPVLPTIEQHFGDLTDPRIDRTPTGLRKRVSLGGGGLNWG